MCILTLWIITQDIYENVLYLYIKVIDRRIRDLQVETELLPLDVAATSLVGKGYR